jgi:hypothetical protein
MFNPNEYSSRQQERKARRKYIRKETTAGAETYKIMVRYGIRYVQPEDSSNKFNYFEHIESKRCTDATCDEATGDLKILNLFVNGLKNEGLLKEPEAPKKRGMYMDPEKAKKLRKKLKKKSKKK